MQNNIGSVQTLLYLKGASRLLRTLWYLLWLAHWDPVPFILVLCGRLWCFL